MGLLADLRKLLRYIYFLFWLSVFCRSNEIQVEIPQNSENKPQGLYFSKALLEGPIIFGGACLQREICVSKLIGLAL